MATVADMVSFSHEAMHRLIRDHPEVFTHAARAVGLPFGELVEVAILNIDLTEHRPLERQVDSLLQMVTTTTEGKFLLLIEAQHKKDPKKPSAWAYYLAYLHAKYRLPAVLLVICQDRATAEWAAEPITIGVPQWTSMIVRPLVLGPHNVPAITDPVEAAADIPLATLSAIAHAKDPNIEVILKSLASGLQVLDEDEFHVWAEMTELGLGDTPAAKIWSRMMTVELSFFRSETSQRLREIGRDEGLGEGRIEGEAESVLRLLDRRGIPVPAAAEERIRTCRDRTILDRWFDRAITATDITEVFAE